MLSSMRRSIRQTLFVLGLVHMEVPLHHRVRWEMGWNRQLLNDKLEAELDARYDRLNHTVARSRDRDYPDLDEIRREWGFMTGDEAMASLKRQRLRRIRWRRVQRSLVG